MTSRTIESVHLTDDPENVKGQIWCAFGQGTGEMKISAEAIAELLREWVSNLPAFLDLWPGHGLQILARAREAGQAAAEKASAEGRDTIIGSDIPSIICLCLS
jgi:hypothetical protein